MLKKNLDRHDYCYQNLTSHPFSWEIPEEFAQMEHEKTTLVLESG